MSTLLKLDCQDNAASTTVLDSSGSGNNGVLTNAGNTSAVSVPDGPGTYLTKSFALNASDANDFVLASVTRSGAVPTSQSIWFKPTLASTSAIIRKITGSNPDVFGVHRDHTNATYKDAAYRGGLFPSAGFGIVSHGVWHHLVDTWDGSNLRTYLDGVLVTTTPTASLLGNATSLALGNNPAGTQGCNGRYCGWRIDEGVAWDATAIAAIIAEKDLPGGDPFSSTTPSVRSPVLSPVNPPRHLLMQLGLI